MPIMTIKEFEKVYCQDILAKAKEIEELLGRDEFSYDAIVYIEGRPTKVCYDKLGKEILVEDIVTLEEPDFRIAYPTDEALELYHTYLSNFTIISGEDLLNQIRNRAKREQERLTLFAENIDL